MPSAAVRSDDELMDAYLGGESRAMEALYLRHKAAVYSWLAGMFPPADADDLYQEAWLRIVRSASSFKGKGFRTWMWRIVRNLAVSSMRKKRPDLVLDQPVDEGEGTVVDGIEDPNAVFAHLKLERDEELERFREAVASLPARRREMLLLRMDAEMSYAEISETLGVPLGTVLATIHRIYKALEKALAGKEE